MAEDSMQRRQARSGEALEARLRERGERGGRRDEPPLNLDPRSAYEVLTRQMVATLTEELREIAPPDAEKRPWIPGRGPRGTRTNHLPGHILRRSL